MYELGDPPAGDERYEIGGVGSFEFGESSNEFGSCTISFDFTLFFATERGPVEPMRFKATSVPIDYPTGACGETD